MDPVLLPLRAGPRDLRVLGFPLHPAHLEAPLNLAGLEVPSRLLVRQGLVRRQVLAAPEPLAALQVQEDLQGLQRPQVQVAPEVLAAQGQACCIPTTRSQSTTEVR